MEFPHISAQASASQFYKACKSKQNGPSKDSSEDSTTSISNQKETEQHRDTVNSRKQESTRKQLDTDHNDSSNSFLNATRDNDEVQNHCTFSLPYIKTLEEKKAFIECPFYEIHVGDNLDAVRIPLEVSPRFGMLKTDFLLFTNGRKTVIFEPDSRRYFCGVQKESCSNEKTTVWTDSTDEQTPGVDPNMPLMKNAEIYSSLDGTIYLIGGNIKNHLAKSSAERYRILNRTFDKNFI